MRMAALSCGQRPCPWLFLIKEVASTSCPRIRWNNAAVLHGNLRRRLACSSVASRLVTTGPLVTVERPVCRLCNPRPNGKTRARHATFAIRREANNSPEPAIGNVFQRLSSATTAQIRKLDGLWGRFVPMAALFFCMAFINTILDSLKDSLVITAAGGGTEVIPFLTVYAVWPASLLFLVLYSYATQRFGRQALFNVTVCCFLAFFGGFAALYPRHESLHLHSLADAMSQHVPLGLSGLVGMVRNWMFTAFYCASELWGDVVLSLLFWGLANETTAMSDAPLLYPIFGVGANIAQTIAGRVLGLFSASAHNSDVYATQLQGIMCLVLGLGACILCLHHFISATFPKTHEGFSRRQIEREWKATKRAVVKRGPGSNGSSSHSMSSVDVSASSASLDDAQLHSGNGKQEPRILGRRPSQEGKACAVETSSPDTKLTIKEAFRFLAQSPQIRCLAIMAIAQGICTNLVDIAWKNHVHMLHPSPGGYSAFMGDVAMWTGVVTGSLMFVSPILFATLGWEGVASVTPRFLLVTGVPFFLLCVAFNHVFGGVTAVGPGAMALQGVVVIGALLQVFGKGAKFSLFKPAEEMVYIGLDEESRSKGKAAIDVVGAQSGKSIGSAMQQVLLLFSGGSVGSILPFMMVMFIAMLRGWLQAVGVLGSLYNPATHHAEDNELLPPAILQTLEDEEEGSGDPLEPMEPLTPSVTNS